MQIGKSQDFARMSQFEDTIKVQKAKAEEKKHREAHEKHAQSLVEKMAKAEERKIMEMETMR